MGATDPRDDSPPAAAPARPAIAPTRRDVLAGSGALALAAALGCRRSPQAQVQRPAITHGVQAGDVDDTSALVWTRADRPGRMWVEWDTDLRFARPRRVAGPALVADGDHAGVVALTELPPGQTIVYRVVVEDGRDRSAPVTGRFRTAPAAGASWRFAWTGDVCGQGWGRNPAHGGLALFGAIRAAEPDFFLHAGDLIYADNPILPSVTLPDGRVWTNVSDEIMARVAQDLGDLRRRFAYNLEDDHYRGLLGDTAIIAQWDDHETHNNWWPGQRLADDRYRERDASALAARARQALFEWTPIRRGPVHRVIRRGPDLDVFVVDLRSFRTPNDANLGDGAIMLGAAQARWLADALAASRATWKIVACDQPLALVIPDGDPPSTAQEGWANGDPGAPRGRERELAALLGELHTRRVDNVVWLTADVHYAAAHHFDPARGQAGAFTPFWEFVAGPAHAGTFGPNPLDPTFGGEARFVWAPPPGTGNLAPWDGVQSFGTVSFDGASRALTVRLHGPRGEEKFAVTIPPAR